VTLLLYSGESKNSDTKAIGYYSGYRRRRCYAEFCTFLMGRRVYSLREWQSSLKRGSGRADKGLVRHSTLIPQGLNVGRHTHDSGTDFVGRGRAAGEGHRSTKSKAEGKRKLGQTKMDNQEKTVISILVGPIELQEESSWDRRNPLRLRTVRGGAGWYGISWPSSYSPVT